MLYLIATPIGNLEDITLRALDALRASDAVLCEDTRRSKILLDRYQIEKPLYSYHKFNETKNLNIILERLRAGEVISLISDAGTPCLNDPGSILVKACIEEGLPFTALPGPCSVINALLLSGFDAARFQFLGFLPKKPSETLRSALFFPGTTLAFDSPERLLDTLEVMHTLAPQRLLAVAREMTKTFEECKRGVASDLIAYFSKKQVKGEICIAIEGAPLPIDSTPLDELIALIQEFHGLDLKEAIKLAAKIKNVPKSEVYRHFHVQ
jgi:16S rRNA (cytidine1402-2'-O)-methyltransferase